MTLLSAGDIALMHDTVIELANATLTKIESPGALAGNGDPGAPVTVWTGTAAGFLQREDRDVLSDGIQVHVTADTFLLFDKAGAPAAAIVAGSDWQASTVVISDERTTPAVLRRFSVTGMEHEADGTLDHVLLTLNAAIATA